MTIYCHSGFDNVIPGLTRNLFFSLIKTSIISSLFRGLVFIIISFPVQRQHII